MKKILELKGYGRFLLPHMENHHVMELVGQSNAALQMKAWEGPQAMELLL